VSGLKFSFERTFKENKWKILLTSLIVVAAIVFGTVVAIKADFADTFKAPIKAGDVFGEVTVAKDETKHLYWFETVKQVMKKW